MYVNKMSTFIFMFSFLSKHMQRQVCVQRRRNWKHVDSVVPPKVSNSPDVSVCGTPCVRFPVPC